MRVGTTGGARTALPGASPPVLSGHVAPHPFAHHADGRRNGRTTPKVLFDHAWLRPVSDHYIDFINPVLRSLEVGQERRASDAFSTSTGSLLLSCGRYLAAVRAHPAAYLLPCWVTAAKWRDGAIAEECIRA